MRLFFGRRVYERALGVLFVFAMGACGNFGGCGACGATAPLPPGGLPANQTVEGGAQIRVTPQGFQKLESILPGALNSSLGNGFCVPHGKIGTPTGGFLATGAEWCYTNQGQCTPGCQANVQLNPGGLGLSVTNSQLLHVTVSTNVHATIPIRGQVIGIGASCTMTADSNDLNGDLDIAFGIDPTTGELDIHVAQINSFHLNMNFSGCSLLSDIGNLAGDIIDSFVGQFVIQLLTPVIDNLLQGFIPHPLGIAGMVDVGKLLAAVSPGTQAEMEARIVPGGYVALQGNGMSLGVITGVNSDFNPATRTGTRPDGVPFASEPALCVPPLPAPNFAAAPYNLPLTTRQTFSLNAANEFSGNPDPNADLAMGLSQTTLDQLGHHMVTSGGMCLGVGTSYIKQLNVGTIGLLVPSLSDLDDSGKAPLLLVTRPQREVSFTIGDNTATSPALTVHLSHLEVDFYAFLFERYVRAFTIDLTMDIGVNLAFDQQPNMPATITPSLTGIDASQVQVVVLNSQFVKETPQHLEMVLPSVFSLITPLLGNLPPITVPSFAGFSLNNLSIQHVTTSQDDFLALYASLGSSPFMRQLATQEPLMAEAVRQMDQKIKDPGPPSAGHAKLLGVFTPPADTIRNALLQRPDGALPEIRFDLDTHDQTGRELEWSWNFNGGMWHDYRPGGVFVIRDAAFAWQGKYTINLRSRVVGDYRTTSAVIATPVIIDSVGPKIHDDQASWDGDTWKIPVTDIVSDTSAIEVAFGAPGADVPATAWGTAQLTRTQFERLEHGGEVVVFAKDEAGNQTIALVAPFHGQAGSSGCACNTGRPGAGGIILFAVVGLLVVRRRRGKAATAPSGRRRRRMQMAVTWVGMVALSSTMPACSCKNAARSCETSADCGQDSCPKGQLPFCVDNMCVCSDDIPPGRIGPYQHVAVSPVDGSYWVSAYAQTYGDLVVAQMPAGGRIPNEQWEWVDGVPDGPVSVPGSKIRGGIADNGPDVGMYTSIAVAHDGTPMVTYFDVDNASLKFAAKVNGTWQIHTIDAGTGSITMTSGALVGMFTSLTLRADDGRPGVAYLAHVADANGEHAEVRYASAQTPLPAAAGDWQTWVVDTADVPMNANDVYPLPEGLGLWVDSARDPRNQAPVVTYYDRGAGELKLARFDTTAGKFATPVVLAGSNGTDAGWTPSVQIDPNGVANVAFVDATHDDLDIVTDASGATPQLIDDGYRIVGTTVDGYPKPEFHILADASLQLITGIGPLVAYQDGTTEELLLANQSQTNGTWSHVSIAGATDPWPGAYGFYTATALSGTDVVMSSWVIDQPTDDNWVEIFAKPISTF